jgi:hypothetical protein
VLYQRRVRVLNSQSCTQEKILQQNVRYHVFRSATYYNNYITTIVRFAFRALEEFVNTNCNKIIKPINYDQERVIRSPMAQARKWMSPQIL